jgi:hypothetical protein
MHARFVLIAATLVSTSAWSAEPSKPAPQPAHGEQPQANVVLASADNVRAPATTTAQQAPSPKRRLARATGCRCGDQEAQPDE